MVQIVGGGRMGTALARGVLRSGVRPAPDLIIAERLEDRRRQLQLSFPGVTVVPRAVKADDSILAVKPDDLMVAAGHLRTAGTRRVLSIAAGVPMDALARALPAGTVIMRAMPNTPAALGLGASALAAGPNCGRLDLSWATELLSAVGVVEVVDEELLDAVTGLSGSGPAFVFLVAEALIAGGVALGLPLSTATRLATQTIAGAGRMLTDSDRSPVELREEVCSPNGTTLAGLGVLYQREVPEALAAAVGRASERAAELGLAWRTRS